MICYGIYHRMGMYGGWSWLIGLIVILLVIWVVIRMSNPNYIGRSAKNNTALDILKERYAKGEINKEEFDTKKKDIMN